MITSSMSESNEAGIICSSEEYFSAKKYAKYRFWCKIVESKGVLAHSAVAE